jgi:hypothetical protein
MYEYNFWYNHSVLVAVWCAGEDGTHHVFEQTCAHPQEDNCMNTTSGIITLC